MTLLVAPWRLSLCIGFSQNKCPRQSKGEIYGETQGEEEVSYAIVIALQIIIPIRLASPHQLCSFSIEVYKIKISIEVAFAPNMSIKAT